MKKGQISIYMAFTMSILLSLILTLVEGARINAMRMQIECATDMGLHSGFAEYNRELLKQYDLFYIDTSYGTKNPSIHNTEEHIRAYMEYNFNPSKDIFVLQTRDFFELKVDTVQISKVNLATDEEGDLLKNQAVSYMKDKVGLEYLDALVTQWKVVEGNELLTRDINQERQDNENEISKIQMPEEEIEPDTWETVKIDNPVEEINKNCYMGSLEFVVDCETISKVAIHPANYVSGRSLNKGILLDTEKKDEISVTEVSDEILWNAYLQEKCGSYVNQLDKSLLKYQIEYILAGENEDQKNLQTVVNQLLFMREVSNVIYIYKDQEKIAEAELMATTLTSVLLVPELEPLIKNSILFAWAYAESINDVKLLLGNKKIPLIKTAKDWNIDLAYIFTPQKETKGEDQEVGLSYSEYVAILLFAMNPKDKVMRFMDLIEMDLRKTDGNREFRLDGCMDGIEAIIEVSSDFGYPFQIKRTYRYIEK